MRPTTDPAYVRDAARAWFAQHWDLGRTVGEWWELLAASGWGVPMWPTEWFGRELSADGARVVNEERRRCGAIPLAEGIGTLMAGPTLLAHGSDEMRRRFLEDMVTGRDGWCQLFSEPGSGSDLASIQTRAVRDGSDWIVDGQKVWTSDAHDASWGILIARTDVDVPKHRGITFFVIDMRQPGIEVRPLREMTGGATFNEVFLTEARVPNANVVGEVNGGWGVAVTTLTHERGSLGGSGSDGGGIRICQRSMTVGAALEQSSTGDRAGIAAAMGASDEILRRLLTMSDAGRSPVIRQAMMTVRGQTEIGRFTAARAAAAAATGRPPGPEMSTGKLLTSNIVRLLRDVGLRMEGAHGMLSGDDAPLGGLVQQLALFSPAISIAGGTDEVQRNIIGERALGLPAELRADRDVAFKDRLIGSERTHVGAS